jgi:hypothetical protein
VFYAASSIGNILAPFISSRVKEQRLNLKKALIISSFLLVIWILGDGMVTF